MNKKREYGVYSRMQECSKHHTRDDDPDGSQTVGERLAVAEDIQLPLVTLAERPHHAEDGQQTEAQREDLDGVVEPITSLVEWQISLMGHNAEQTTHESQSIELH